MSKRFATEVAMVELSRRPAALLLGAALLCLPLVGLASDITFSNSGTPPVTVEVTSDIRITPEGNYTASCRKDAASDDYCAGIESSGSSNGPLLTFTVSRTTVGLTDPDKSVRLDWSTTPAAEVCTAAGTSNAVSQGWSGVQPGSGRATFTYSAVGTYSYTLSCYNASGKSEPVTRTVQVQNSVVTPPGCNVIKSQIADPLQRSLFQPEGFEDRQLGWNQLFGPGAVYPNTIASEVYPVGSYTLAGNQHANPVSTRGRYITVPIVGNGNPYKFEWIQAKPSQIYNYAPARPTDFKYVTLSTCRGDFRTTSAYSAADPVNDPTLIQQCRNQVIAETGLYYGPTGFGRCPVMPGKTYYLNIVYASPADGLSPIETGCRDTSGGVCETSWKHLTDGN